MKITIKHMELNKSRANLVKVAKQIQGKTGAYQSHRWVNPNKALEMLKQGIKGIETNDDITFVSKKDGQSISEKELLKKFKQNGNNQTIQQYVKANYSIQSKEPRINEYYRDRIRPSDLNDDVVPVLDEQFFQPATIENDTENENTPQDVGDIKESYRAQTLNGVPRHKPMTFKQADSGSTNPKYGKAGHSTNCQSAIAVFEARLRGYDLETLPNNNQTRCKELSKRSSEIWIAQLLERT